MAKEATTGATAEKKVTKGEKTITTQREVLRRLTGPKPYVVRVPLKDRRKPFMYREDVGIGKYEPVRESVFLRLKKTGKIVEVNRVENRYHSYADYGPAK